MPLAIRFVVGPDWLQVTGHLGDVLRGFTQHPPLIHALGMADRSRCHPTSHLRAYQFGTHGMLLHLVLEGEKTTTFGTPRKNERRNPRNNVGCLRRDAVE